MTSYILVGWPDIQRLMNHPRWGECIFCQSIAGHKCEDNTYAIPEDLYEEVFVLPKRSIEPGGVVPCWRVLR